MHDEYDEPQAHHTHHARHSSPLSRSAAGAEACALFASRHERTLDKLIIIAIL